MTDVFDVDCVVFFTSRRVAERLCMRALTAV